MQPQANVSSGLIDSSLRAPLGVTGARVALGDNFYANDGVVPVFRYRNLINVLRQFSALF